MSYQKITGTIESLGQSTYDNVQRTYSYIRIIKDDGEVTYLRDFTVAGDIDSYINTDLHADFYIAQDTVKLWGKDASHRMLFGLKTKSGRKVFDTTPIDINIEVLKFGALKLALTGLVVLIVLVGIPVIAFAYKMYRNAKQWQELKYGARQFFDTV